MRETFGDELEGATQQQNLENEGEIPPWFQEHQGVLNELREGFEKQNEVLEAMANYILDQHKSTQAGTEDKELEEYLGLLQEEYGEFDEEYVLTKMYNGASGEEAVQAWKNMVQQHINQASQSENGLPPVLSSSGGSAVARENAQRLGSVAGKDIRALVADVMSQANRESQ